MTTTTTLRLAAAISASLCLGACSGGSGDSAPQAQSKANTASLAGACEQYLETYNKVSDHAMEQFYKLYRAAGKSEQSIESARDHWRFLGGQIEEAMLEDEWASLTVWHRNLQDHLHSITVLSGENHYDFPEDAEEAVQMSDRLEGEYVRCKFLRSMKDDSKGEEA